MRINDILTLNYEGLRVLYEGKLPEKTNKYLRFIGIFNARVVKINEDHLTVKLLKGFILEPSFKNKQFRIPKSMVKPIKMRTGFIKNKTYIRLKYY